MRAQTLTQKLCSLFSRKLFLLAAAMVVLFGSAPTVRGQSVDFSPAALSKQRATLVLKATHTPVAQLEGEVNHLAVLSEMCRAESGAKACGLSDKPLASNTLDDRYAYYVRKPMEAHSSGRLAKVDRHNWQQPATASK